MICLTVVGTNSSDSNDIPQDGPIARDRTDFRPDKFLSIAIF